MTTEAVRHFNDAVRRDPADARNQWFRVLDAFAERGIMYGGAPMPTFLRPQFVDRDTWASLTTAATQLIQLGERVSKRAFGGRLDDLLDFLGAPETHRGLLRLSPPGPDVSLSRVDGFISGGKVRFVEINSDAPAGFGYADRMSEVFARMPLVEEISAPDPPRVIGSLDALVAELRSHARAQNPRVAIVDLASVPTRPDQEILREEFMRRGLTTILADPRDLQIIGERLVAAGEPIDVVYRRTVISEVLGIEREAGAFFEAHALGLATFVNSFRCYLSEDKAFFAILTDERFSDLMSAAEREFVARHLPWTRKVEDRTTQWQDQTIELLPWIERHRDQLVLKPNHGYGGDSVVIGSSVTDEAWSKAVDGASPGGWIVQERVKIPEEEFPVFDADGALHFESLKINTNPFYVGGAPVGAVTRVSRDAVINVSAGGGSIPTFVV